MINELPWTKLPIVGVSLNPIWGPHVTPYAFCDLAVAILYPDGLIETVVDSRTRCIPSDASDVRRLGEFTAEETRKYNLFGEYAKEAREVSDLIHVISNSCKGCVPLAINARMSKDLLHRSVRVAEGRGLKFAKQEVFVLRERSNWIDLGLWRLNAGAERFSVHPTPPLARLREAFSLVPVLAEKVGARSDMTLPELFHWQGGLIPF